jgi:uncharacterized lipoprotein YddW (UPF0748 family)
MFRADSANAGRGAAPARVRAIRWAEVLTALALASPAPVRVAGDRSAANPGPAPALEASGAAPRAGVGKAAAHAVTLARGDAAASPAAPAGGARCEELRGIWIPTDGPRDWDTLMRRLRAAGLNAVFVRVAQGGKAIYPSRVLPQDHWAADAGGDELERAIVAAHRHGLEFHAWKVCFHLSSAKARPAGTAAREFYERVARDDRLVRDSKGTQSYWLNPADPRNQDLELRVAREVAENYAVDGYHLDYIRYPDAEPGFDFHFGAVSRREFEKSLGRPVADWPTAVISGVLKQRYEDWERDNITGLVRRIRAELIARRPGTLLSAAVWRNVHFNRATVKQDWPRWGREGLVDFLVPMVYVIDPDEFRSTLARDFSTVCGRVPFLAGIGSWRLKSTGALVDQVRSARQLGADGFVLFSADAAQIDEQLEALAAAATKQPALPGIGLAWFEFDLPAESARRRYNYPAVEAGRATTLTVRLRRCAAGFGENLPASVSVEDLSGRPIGAPQRFALAPGDTQSVSFVPAGAPQRLVLRYRLGRSSAACAGRSLNRFRAARSPHCARMTSRRPDRGPTRTWESMTTAWAPTGSLKRFRACPVLRRCGFTSCEPATLRPSTCSCCRSFMTWPT